MVGSCITSANHGVVHVDVAIPWSEFGSNDEVRDPTTRRVQRQAKVREREMRATTLMRSKSA